MYVGFCTCVTWWSDIVYWHMLFDSDFALLSSYYWSWYHLWLCSSLFNIIWHHSYYVMLCYAILYNIIHYVVLYCMIVLYYIIHIIVYDMILSLWLVVVVVEVVLCWFSGRLQLDDPCRWLARQSADRKSRECSGRRRKGAPRIGNVYISAD